MGKRIFLFLLTNILVVATISIITSLLGVNHYLSRQGINYEALLILALVWGMTGSFISLALSKVMAKWMMGVHVIDPKRAVGAEAELYSMVARLARDAKLPAMPEVGIYESPELNAFATGPSKSSSLVAVSTGLLERMQQNEVEGVLAHEVAHIANGDMVTMTLIQGIVNAFTFFLARVFAFFLSSFMRDEEGNVSPLVNFVLVLVLDIIFTLLGSIVVAYFSRQREYRADAGGAKLAGKNNMIGALARLSAGLEIVDEAHNQPAMASLKISSQSGWLELFSTHPPLSDRIARLKTLP